MAGLNPAHDLLQRTATPPAELARLSESERKSSPGAKQLSKEFQDQLATLLAKLADSRAAKKHTEQRKTQTLADLVPQQVTKQQPDVRGVNVSTSPEPFQHQQQKGVSVLDRAGGGDAPRMSPEPFRDHYPTGGHHTIDSERPLRGAPNRSPERFQHRHQAGIQPITGSERVIEFAPSVSPEPYQHHDRHQTEAQATSLGISNVRSTGKRNRNRYLDSDSDDEPALKSDLVPAVEREIVAPFCLRSSCKIPGDGKQGMVLQSILANQQ